MCPRAIASAVASAGWVEADCPAEWAKVIDNKSVLT
jgi:hypothetical protein